MKHKKISGMKYELAPKPVYKVHRAKKAKR
jgi:hypothetical protein